MVRECPHEREVAALVRAGRWPDACAPALVAHVTRCADCRDVVDISELLLQADRGVDVRVPSAAQVWWRLAVRARLEREQAAARPVVWLQGLAAACGVGLALGAVGQVGPAFVQSASALAGRVAGAMPGLAAAAGALLLLVVAATTAVYLWIADE